MTETDLPALYLKTRVLLEQDGHLVPVRHSERLSAETIHIITAWNPGDARPTHEENEQASQELYRCLRELGTDPVRAIGQDPDSEHFEESWAVQGLTDEQARQLGADFHQVAVFRITAKTQTVLACDGSWERSRPL